MIVFEEVVKIALCLLAFLRQLAVSKLMRKALHLIPLLLIVSSLVARFAPVKSLLFVIFILVTGINSLG